MNARVIVHAGPQVRPSFSRAPTSASPRWLQRQCSCRGVGGATGECPECKRKRLQTKLTIGASSDPLEQEADLVADQVLAMPAHTGISVTRPQIQRHTGEIAEGSDVAPASVYRVLAGPGQPLAPALQSDMEHRFGYDFSRVRLHTGGAADQSTRDISANAYTVGHDIVFGAGRYSPETHEGRKLIAHELTHVAQQHGTSMGTTLQRAINPACTPIRDRNKSNAVCKAPPSSENLGKRAHGKIQSGFAAGPDRLREVVIPGAGNVCSESKLEPEFAPGYVDLVKVLARSEKTVHVEIAEIKPLNEHGLSLGPSQVKCYRDHLRDTGSMCQPLATYSPKKLQEAQKDPTVKKAVQMCKSLDAFGKTVTVSDDGLILPPQVFELFGRPMTALTCFDGVVCYSCVDPEEKSRERDRDVGEVLANPGSEVAVGFMTGFLAGGQRTVPAGTWATIGATLKKPENLARFIAGQAIGRPAGVVASIGDLLGGFGELLKLAVKVSPAGLIASELRALSKSEESPMIRRARVARDLVEGLQQLGAEINRNHYMLFDTGEGIGELCGEEVGRRFLKEFVAADPYAMGVIVGKVQGYLATEIAMLLVGAEEFALAGKAISAVAKGAKATRFARLILEMLETNAALKRLLDAFRGAPRLRVAAEVAEAAKAEKAAELAKAERGREATQRARDTQRAIDAEKALKEAEEGEESTRKLRMTK